MLWQCGRTGYRPLVSCRSGKSYLVCSFIAARIDNGMTQLGGSSHGVVTDLLIINRAPRLRSIHSRGTNADLWISMILNPPNTRCSLVTNIVTNRSLTNNKATDCIKDKSPHYVASDVRLAILSSLFFLFVTVQATPHTLFTIPLSDHVQLCLNHYSSCVHIKHITITGR